MNDEKDPNSKQNPRSLNFNERMELNDLIWSFCPVCGKKIPKIQNLRFCITCGTDLKYLKEHKKILPRKITNPYIKVVHYPHTLTPTILYGPEKISDENLINTREKKLWGMMISLGLPLGAFLLMNFVVLGFFMLIMYISFDLNMIYDLISNSYFIILSTIFELIFILVPVLYVGKYLQNPTLKNRFTLLGFTSKSFDRRQIFKEILVGLGFAVVGYCLVLFVSIMIELLLELIFNIEIITEIDSVESSIIPSDILSLIFFSVVMILVVATSEEILFRGFMQKGLVRNLGNRWGLIVTAFTFSIIHLLGLFVMVDSPLNFIISFLLSFIPYFSISIMLGLIYQWRGENLIAVIITHGVYNAITIIIPFIFA